MESEKEVHQHITNESGFIWKLTPFEIKDHLKNPVIEELDSVLSIADFDFGDDIITGSGEEDRVLSAFLDTNKNHFFDPDQTMNGYYTKGLFSSESSYVRARGLWQKKVIPLYVKGKRDEASWYLGRVAHLLEDASQPSHVLSDRHWPPSIRPSILETYTGDNYSFLKNDPNWQGNNFLGQQYNYENLMPDSNFDWSQIDSKHANLNDPGQQGLFRLFWYTAQKTQYFASDRKDADYTFKYLNGSTGSWDKDSLSNNNLWKEEGFTGSDFISSGLNEANVDQETDAVVPHAMKATAGLYRLFWDAVAIDWPMYHHDLRRTGFTLLKGNLRKSDDSQASWTLDSTVNPGAFDFPNVLDGFTSFTINLQFF